MSSLRRFDPPLPAESKFSEFRAKWLLERMAIDRNQYYFFEYEKMPRDIQQAVETKGKGKSWS